MHSITYDPRLVLPQPRKGPLSFDGLIIQSGVNTLSDADYLKLSSHPDYSRFVATGALREGVVTQAIAPTPEVKAIAEVPSTPSVNELPTDLSDLTVVEAEVWIEKVKDIEVLGFWLEAEESANRPRKTVVEALKKQIAEAGAN